MVYNNDNHLLAVPIFTLNIFSPLRLVFSRTVKSCLSSVAEVHSVSYLMLFS